MIYVFLECVLVVYVLQGICLFHLSCQISWHKVVYNLRVFFLPVGWKHSPAFSFSPPPFILLYSVVPRGFCLTEQIAKQTYQITILSWVLRWSLPRGRRKQWFPLSKWSGMTSWRRDAGIWWTISRGGNGVEKGHSRNGSWAKGKGEMTWLTWGTAWEVIQFYLSLGVRKRVEKEEAIQLDRSCRALSARIKEFGWKQSYCKGFSAGAHTVSFGLYSINLIWKEATIDAEWQQGGNFPGSPVVKNPPSKKKKKNIHLPMQGMWVQSLVRELRSHIPGATHWACVLQWQESAHWNERSLMMRWRFSGPQLRSEAAK